MPLIKIEFATVRELEKKTFRIFAYGGGAFGVGLLMTLVGMAIIGAPIMIVSILVVIAAMAYVSMLGKETSRPLFCPYCSSKNDVYASRRNFECDICRRPVLVTEDGEVIAADENDLRARYNA